MHKRIIIWCTLCFLFFTSAAQEKNRIFYDGGLGFLSDYSASPVIAVTMKSDQSVYNSQTGTRYYPDTTKYYQVFAFNLATFIFRLRANVLQPRDNLALSINTMPAFGFGFVFQKPGDGTSLFSFNLPLMAELDFGAGATFKTEADHGGFIAGGYEFMKAPLLPDQDFLVQPGWGQPVVAAGYRYWSKFQKLMELNLKVGFAKNGTLPPLPYHQHTGSPVSVRLALLMFINY